jgi:Cation transport ATPase
VIATGPNTYFGHIARSLAGEQEETSFDRGVKRYTWLMIRFMLVMVPLVFVINGLTNTIGAKRFSFQWRSPWTHAGNVADDCVGLLVQGRDGDVTQEGHR